MKNTITLDHEFIVSQLALTDVRFWPLRRGTLGQTAEWSAQRDYRLDGIPLTPDDAGDRKIEERRRNRLAEAGTIEIVRGSKRDRAIGTRLTNSADWKTRAALGRPGLHECLKLMTKMQALVTAGRFSPAWDDRRFVSELDLAGLDTYDARGGWRTKVYQAEFSLIPAIIREWVQPHSLNAWQDCPDGGVVEFSLTDAGREVIANPPAIGKLPTSDPELVALYGEVFQSNAPARCWTPDEIAAEICEEWDAAVRFAYTIVRRQTKHDPSTFWPRPEIMRQAIEAEGAAHATGRTLWPGLSNSISSGTSPMKKQPPAAPAVQPPANPAGE